MDTGFATGLIRERSEPPSPGTNKRTIAEFDIWREGAHNPIISRELWHAYRGEAPGQRPRSITLAGRDALALGPRRLPGVLSLRIAPAS